MEWRGAAPGHHFIPVPEFFMYQGLWLLLQIQKIMAILVAMADREILLFTPEQTFWDFGLHLKHGPRVQDLLFLSLGWTEERPKYSTIVSFPTQLCSQDCSGLSLYSPTALFVLYPVQVFYFVFVFCSDHFFFYIFIF